MKKIINKIIISSISFAILMLLFTNNVHAVLQANKPDGVNNKSLVSKTAREFFEAIREMETKDGTLGVSSTIDTENGTFSDSSNNGMDCHMALNTEWGTAAMLSTSSYGTPPSTQNSTASTTGNNSGIFQMGDNMAEYVAGINTTTEVVNDSGTTFISNLNDIYYNNYENWNSFVPNSLPGDGFGETNNWCSNNFATYSTSVTSSNRTRKFSIMTRNRGGYMFGFGPSNVGNSREPIYSGEARSDISSRAVLVFADELE